MNNELNEQINVYQSLVNVRKYLLDEQVKFHEPILNFIKGWTEPNVKVISMADGWVYLDFVNDYMGVLNVQLSHILDEIKEGNVITTEWVENECNL